MRLYLSRANEGRHWWGNQRLMKAGGNGDGDGDGDDAGGGAHSLSKADAIRFAQC